MIDPNPLILFLILAAIAFLVAFPRWGRWVLFVAVLYLAFLVGLDPGQKLRQDITDQPTITQKADCFFSALGYPLRPFPGCSLEDPPKRGQS